MPIRVNEVEVREDCLAKVLGVCDGCDVTTEHRSLCREYIPVSVRGYEIKDEGGLTMVEIPVDIKGKENETKT